MNEDDKNAQDATKDGAVEIHEEDLDQASGGAIYMQVPAEQQDFHRSSEFPAELKDPGHSSMPSQDPSIGLLSEPEKKL